MSTTPTADEFLLGGSSGKSAFGKDDPIGTTVSGTIIDTQIRQQTKLEDGSPLTWDNGDPRMQLVITIQTDQRIPDEPDDDGIRAIYVKGSKAPGSRSLHDAVRAAVQTAGADGLKPDGVLTVQLIGTEPSKTRGYNDRKLWAAAYKAPDPTAASAGFLGTGAPASTPTPAPAQVQQPVSVAQPVQAVQQPTLVPPPAQQAVAPQAPTPAPAGGDVADKVRQLIALGIDDPTIADATGLDPTVIATFRNAAA